METEKRRHFVNIRGKECVQIFLRLNIIGPPTEEQAAPQKVKFSLEKKEFLESQYKVVKFSGVDSDKSYTVRVSLLLNGKSIATAQKSLKALTKVHPEIQVEAA